MLKQDDMTAVKAIHNLTMLGRFGPSRTEPIQSRSLMGKNSKVLGRFPSIRAFTSPSLSESEMEWIIKESYSNVSHRRAVPSAGGIYGLVIYILQLIGGLSYIVKQDGSMEKLLSSPVENDAVSSLLFHQISGPASIFFLHGNLSPYILRYGIRGYRYLLLEAGHLAQEMIHLAQLRDLRSCPIGAFDDNGVIEITGCSLANFVPLYAVAIGRAYTREK